MTNITIQLKIKYIIYRIQTNREHDLSWGNLQKNIDEFETYEVPYLILKSYYHIMSNVLKITTRFFLYCNNKKLYVKQLLHMLEHVHMGNYLIVTNFIVI